MRIKFFLGQDIAKLEEEVNKFCKNYGAVDVKFYPIDQKGTIDKMCVMVIYEEYIPSCGPLP